MQGTFRESLSYGKTGESYISKYLQKLGFDVLPVYEKIIDEGKGPQLFTPNGAFIAPDILAFNKNKVLWVEAKHKTAFTWYRKTNEWLTGINIRHYEYYKQIEKRGPWPIYLFFLHDGGQAKDSPVSESGLFGEYLSELTKKEHHRWEPLGMVYWSKDSLKKIIDIKDLMRFINVDIKHL